MNLHLHLGGKVGELLFASGTFPAIRERWPGARLILHLHPAYVSIVEGLKYQPDDVQTYTIARPGKPLALQVTSCLRLEHRLNNGLPMLTRSDGDAHCLMYGVHQWNAGRPNGPPFYRLFMDAAAVGTGPYRQPEWCGAPFLYPKQVIVFPSGNVHVGTPRTIALTPSAWETFAAGIRAAGLEPRAIVHPDDPRPVMPGWEFYETTDPRVVLLALKASARVLGLNSGIVFAACLLSPGRVTMIDSQGNRPEYRFGPMVDEGVLDGARHFQIAPEPDLEIPAWRAVLG